MNSWEYKGGVWSEIEDPLRWSKYPNDDFRTLLKRNGYMDLPLFSNGDDTPLCIDLYGYVGAGTDGGAPWLISFNPAGSIVEHVFIYDIPSLMQWLSEYLPVFLLADIAQAQGESRGKASARFFGRRQIGK